MLDFAFWACFFLVVYTYLGYGLVIYLLAKFIPYNNKKSGYFSTNNDLPELTLCIAAYNEAEVIPMKMENCLRLRYPKDKIKILWVIDGSSDESYSLLQDYPEVKILFKKEREGKTAAINRAMEEVSSPLVVFTDANCLLSPDALQLIAETFQDETIGCVAGEKRISFFDEDSSSSKGEGFYWRYESLLKKWDYTYYSAVGAAGELFAIRSSLFTPISTSILLDDFMISMNIVLKGFRIAYIPEAYAVERGSLNIEEEKKRKVRIAAGGWQSVWLLKSLLNIVKYGRVSFQYISHRVLRWTITPFAFFLLLPMSFGLAFLQHEISSLYVTIFLLQIIFYVLSGIGYIKRNDTHISKAFFIPFYFVFMNFNILEGLLYLKNKSKSAIWEKSERRI